MSDPLNEAIERTRMKIDEAFSDLSKVAARLKRTPDPRLEEMRAAGRDVLRHFNEAGAHLPPILAGTEPGDQQKAVARLRTTIRAIEISGPGDGELAPKIREALHKAHMASVTVRGMIPPIDTSGIDTSDEGE